MDNWESLIASRMRPCASMPRYEDARQENVRNAQRNYKRKHREKQNECQRKWAKKNPDYWRNYNKAYPEKKALWNKTYLNDNELEPWMVDAAISEQEFDARGSK